jgi:peptidoglycan DL-endopeptidase CwlO
MFQISGKVHLLLTSALLAGALVLPAGLAAPALAADEPPSGFPSWEDVQKAKQNENAKSSEIDRINNLLDGLQTEAAGLGDTAITAGADYALAAGALEKASAAVDVLAAQTARAAATSEQYRKEAGALAAHSYRTGGTGLGVFATLEAVESKDGLQGLDLLNILTDKAGTLYNRASSAQDVVQALTEQQAAATAERERLAREAKAKLDAAQAAQDAMNRKVTEQQQQGQVLVAQLAALKDSTADVENEYREGREALAAYQAAQQAKERAAEAERQRQAAQAAQAASAAAAAPAAPGAGAGAGPAPAPAPPAVVAPNLPGAVGNNPAAAQAYASSRLGAFGWDGSQFQCLVQLWNRESNWRTTATNPYSGAYGIPQSLPGSKMASAGSDWMTNYQTQVNWGLGYIRDRYGSPCGAWGHSENLGWY